MLGISQEGFIESLAVQPSTAQLRQCGHQESANVIKFKNTGSSLFMPLYQHHISLLIPKLMMITSIAVLFLLN